MDARARASGVPLLVALAPSFAQVTDDGWAAVLRQGGARPEDHDRDGPARRLSAFATARGIPLLDLTPDLRAAAERGEVVYDPEEQHWTARGNAVVAEALLRRLRGDPALRRALQAEVPEPDGR